MKLQICLLTLLLALMMSETRAAEDSTKAERPCRIEMDDGSVMIGRIVGEPADSVLFVTLSGLWLTIPRAAIEKIISLEGEVTEGQFRRIDPNRSRLFIGPTARPVRSGTGYFSAYGLFFPVLAFGIGDVLTLTGGISLLPGAEDQLFYLGPKVSIPTGSDAAQIVLGMQYVGMLGGEDDGAGIVYGATTLGSPYTAVTLGAGWGFSGENFSEMPVLLAGFEGQISGSVKIILENWIPGGGEVSIHALGI